jgi:hypothetical protein
MTLPLISRYVRIEAPSETEGDAYAPQTYTVVGASVPAHIGPPSARATGDRFQETDAVLYVDDTATIPIGGRVTDLTTGDVYAIDWTESVIGVGLDHRKVGLRKTSGAQ